MNIVETSRGQVSLPDQFERLRPHQDRAVSQILDWFNSGTRAVILDAPTGAGKTVIGEVVRQLWAKQTLYVCTTKTLQRQFVEDFPYARLIQGRANYPTFDRPELFDEQGPRHVDCSDCRLTFAQGPQCATCEETGVAPTEEEPLHCDWCHPVAACPYRRAKLEALAAPLAVANTAYFLSEANLVGRMSGRYRLVVVDEADTLESILMGFVEIGFSPRQLRQMGLSIPEKVTKPESWLEWLGRAIEAAESLRGARYDAWQAAYGDSEKRAAWKALQAADRLVVQAKKVRAMIEADPDNWVLDDYKRQAVTFRPVDVWPYAADVFWQHADRWLLMSGTVVSAAQLAHDVGLDAAGLPWSLVQVDSQFPVERRPVHVVPRAAMSHRREAEEAPKMVEAVCEVVSARPGVRILVHAVSYRLSERLVEELRTRFPGRRVFSYTRARDREAVLQEFKVTPGAVLVAPSMDRGVDLPDDLCRVIVVAKVPFPNVGDKQVAAKLYGRGAVGRTWFEVQTVRTLVQMTGRGMRHRDDWVESFILDANFSNIVWRKARHLVPKWWADALRWHPTGRVPGSRNPVVAD